MTLKNLKLDTLLDSISNGVIAINSDGIITIFNKAAAQILNISVKDTIDKKIKDVIPETKLLKILETGKATRNKKMHLKNKTILTNRSPILDENNKLVGAVGVFQDISEIEQLVAELKLNKKVAQELDEIIENSFDGICISDGEGSVQNLNSAYEGLLNVKKENLIGKHLKDVVHEQHFHDSVVLKVLKEKKPVTIMEEVAETGKKVMKTGKPIFDEEGKIKRIVTNVRDITLLNNLKNELETNKRLNTRYKRELSRLQIKDSEQSLFVFKSNKMQNVVERSLLAAQTNATILVTGESGVGKEVITNLIVQNSERKKEAFIKVNCAAIPETLLESELFGYEKGAFTGASNTGKTGMIEMANYGTLFLDEISTLPYSLQAKLLRVIQEKELLPLGGTKPVALDIRIISATNQNLQEMVEQQKFRADLFYRLNVVPINIPPLRERKEDIHPIIIFFLEHFNALYNKQKTFTPEAINYLINCELPGNVRELKNIIEQLVILSRNDEISISDLLFEYQQKGQQRKDSLDKIHLTFDDLIPLEEARGRLEKKLIEKALETCGSTRIAAQKLGVHQSTIHRKLVQFNKLV